MTPVKKLLVLDDPIYGPVAMTWKAGAPGQPDRYSGSKFVTPPGGCGNDPCDFGATVFYDWYLEGTTATACNLILTYNSLVSGGCPIDIGGFTFTIPVGTPTSISVGPFVATWGPAEDDCSFDNTVIWPILAGMSWVLTE